MKPEQVTPWTANYQPGDSLISVDPGTGPTLVTSFSNDVDSKPVVSISCGEWHEKAGHNKHRRKRET